MIKETMCLFPSDPYCVSIIENLILYNYQFTNMADKKLFSLLLVTYTTSFVFSCQK